MDSIHSFPPIINASCTRLILGSIPGQKSLAMQEYYAHPQNTFWRILFALYNEPPKSHYREKQNFLLSHHIAVWDVIAACQREGSLDSQIADPTPNDFGSLFSSYPNISHVFFNGRKAFDTYKKHVGFDDDRTYTLLPSTSPAHAIGFEAKLLSWQILL